eukprot:Phypoly_transcript_07196.p1 GENE.Phypoly_transcript_07196~~Phypoly_transcript_07196.p1  ORF type:complete len:492 (+),score=58.38 Phypoly_transcript_07196:100-1575(+)
MEMEGDPLEELFFDQLSVQYMVSEANKGDVTAQTAAGSAYFFGRGAEKDYVKAVHWYTKAAQAGTAPECMEAQFNLGCIYQHGGYGVKKDVKKAVEWLKVAARNKGMSAQQLAYLYLALGNVYWTGEGEADGVPKDLKLAEMYFQKAIDTDKNPKASYNLGIMYMQSNDTTKKKDSVRLFQIGAEQGEGNSMFMLGQAYFLGETAPHNLNLAKKWLTKALKVCDDVSVIEQIKKLLRVEKEWKEEHPTEVPFLYQCAQCGAPDSQKKLLVCSRCKLVKYCSPECQRSHWKKHKPECNKPLDVKNTMPIKGEEKATNYSDWQVLSNKKTAYATGKVGFLISKLGGFQGEGIFTVMCVGLNAKVSKSDKIFMKQTFGDGSPSPESGLKKYDDGNFLSWEVGQICPYCNTKCKQGHFSVQFMFRSAAGTMRLRTIPRVWHFQCLSPIVKAQAPAGTAYPLEDCKIVSVEEGWTMAQRDTEEVSLQMQAAVSTFG